MPEEKIANMVSEIDFSAPSFFWMPALEKCFHRVIKFEYYLDKIPGNLMLPKYRKIAVGIVFRLFSQVPRSRLRFSRNIYRPDPVIKEFLEYLAVAEIRRQKALLKKYPPTDRSIRSLLIALKNEMEL